MKKLIAILLTVSMIFVVTACGADNTSSNSTKTDSVSIQLPAVDKARAVVEQMGAIAVDQYVYARIKTDELIEYDLETGSLEELSEMVEQTMQAWQVAEAAATATEQMTSDVEDATSASTSTQGTSSATSKLNTGDLTKANNPFVLTAEAAEENAAMKWAEEITKKFDSYPANAKIKTLAENLGTDAKQAYKQLQMAQEIIKGDADYTGDMSEYIENSLLVTKTGCKVGLLVTGYIASGGAISANPFIAPLQATAFAVSTADTLMDVTTTGCTIVRGRNDSVTLSAAQMQDTFATTAAIAGGFSAFSSKIGTLKDVSERAACIDKVTFLADNIMSYINEGKILSFQVSEKDGTVEVTAKEIDSADMSEDEIKKELESAGVDVSDTETLTAKELALQTEQDMGGVWTVEDIENVSTKLEESIQSQTETLPSTTVAPKTETPSTTQEDATEATDANEEDIESEYPTMEELAGTYRVVTLIDEEEYEEGDWEVFYENNELFYYEDDEKIPMNYNQNTGELIVNGYVFEQSIKIIQKFKKDGSKITFDYYWENDGVRTERLAYGYKE